MKRHDDVKFNEIDTKSVLFVSTMKTAVLLTLLAPAAAFAPAASNSRSSTALNVDISNAFGVSQETGNKVPFMGAKLLEDADEAGLKWFQNSEIKHGRAAMLATIGYWVQADGIHFPLYATGSNGLTPESADNWFLSTSADLTFTDLAAMSPLDAIQAIPTAGLFQIFVFAGLFEACAWQRQWVDNRPVPGDYGYDPLGFTKRPGGLESEELKNLRLKELKNGRLAM